MGRSDREGRVCFIFISLCNFVLCTRNEGRDSKTLYSATEDRLNNGIDQVWQNLEKLKIYVWDLTERYKVRFEVVE